MSNLIKSNSLFEQLFDNRSSWMREFFDYLDLPQTNYSEDRVWEPRFKVNENSESYDLTVFVPGLANEDLKVEVDDNLIFISYIHTETLNRYYSNSWSLTRTLPDDVARDKVRARVDNGVLSVLLPKKKEVKRPPRVIDVE